MARLIRLIFFGFALCLGLAACAGSPAAPTSIPAAPTVAPTQAEPVGPVGAGLYADIPQGVTAEGYQYLGDPDAALNLVMYSDFL
ncbi:MAG: hypothetical protein HC822_21925 [Oscillochloris sp.]|nr:hypothetical protein [Oscillochloris sp.]